MNVCAACRRNIQGVSVVADNKSYHENCFVCTKCLAPLRQAFVLSASGAPLCENCSIKEAPSNVCFSCNGPIKGSVLTAVGQQYHPVCFKCSKCGIKLENAYQVLNEQPVCDNCALNGMSTPQKVKGILASNDNIADVIALDKPNNKGCGKCYKPIEAGTIVKALNKRYHDDCFKCTRCNRLLTGSYNSPDHQNPFCLDCYHRKFGKKCRACRELITEQEFTVFEGENYHQACFKCTICGRCLSGQLICMSDSGVCCSFHSLT